MTTNNTQKNIDEEVKEFREETKDCNLEQWCVAYIAWAVTMFKFNEDIGDGKLTNGDRSWVTKELTDKFDQFKQQIIKEERERLSEEINNLKPILYDENKDRHLENVTRYNALDEVLSIIKNNK